MSDRVELTGMVLSAIPVGEYDKRIVLLTKERGKISGFAKGARRQNSPLMAAANPFAFGTFECYEGRTSYNIYQAQISNFFEKLSQDFESAYCGMYFLEFADYYAREGSDEREMLNLLYVTLRALERGQVSRKLIRSIFELRTMVINGEYPEMFACVNCGTRESLTAFSTDKNGVLCGKCYPGIRGHRMQDSAVYAMQYIITAPLNKLYSFTLKDEVQREVETVTGLFRDKMIDREFKSLGILNMLDIL